MPAPKLNIQTAAQGASAPAPRPVLSGVQPAAPAQAGPSSGVAPAAAQTSSSAAQSVPRPPRPAGAAQPSSSLSSSPQPQPQPSASSQELIPDSPPFSPISPALNPLQSRTPIPPPKLPANYASLGGRAPLTHISHPEIVPSAPAPPVPREPIDFESNSDVIALKSAIAILQMQKRQAEQDLIKLRDAKNAALERPVEFATDLASGRVYQEGVRDCPKSDEDEKSSDDAEMSEGNDSEPRAVNGLKPSAMKASSTAKGKATASRSDGSNGSSAKSKTAPPPWANLPTTQNIYRCPPINWSQYAVEGEALNRLHNEQVSGPTLGTPAAMGANGTFQFTGAANPDDGRKVDGIAAPYNPLRDKRPPKSGASKRGV